MFSHPQESRAPSHVTVTWEDKGHHSLHCHPLPSSSPSPLYAEHDVVWYGISLWSVGVSCPVCVPSQLPVTGSQGEELSTSLSTSPPQEAVGSNGVAPQPPSLQTKQAQSPQPLLTGSLPALPPALLPSSGCIQGPEHPS